MFDVTKVAVDSRKVHNLESKLVKVKVFVYVYIYLLSNIVSPKVIPIRSSLNNFSCFSSQILCLWITDSNVNALKLIGRKFNSQSQRWNLVNFVGISEFLDIFHRNWFLQLWPKHIKDLVMETVATSLTFQTQALKKILYP